MAKKGKMRGTKKGFPSIQKRGAIKNVIITYVTITRKERNQLDFKSADALTSPKINFYLICLL